MAENDSDAPFRQGVDDDDDHDADYMPDVTESGQSIEGKGALPSCSREASVSEPSRKRAASPANEPAPKKHQGNACIPEKTRSGGNQPQLGSAANKDQTLQFLDAVQELFLKVCVLLSWYNPCCNA